MAASQGWSIGRRTLSLLVVGAFLLTTVTLLLTSGSEAGDRRVVAHLPGAVGVYEGTDVRILGVTVGEVTRVTPDGDSVIVEMRYDATYDVPEDAEALVIQPTLVADRFVQLSPAYVSGPKLADNADIPLPRTGVPVELDRIYRSIGELTLALGPNGANKDGSLNALLKASAKALDGNGATGNEMIGNLSDAMSTLRRASPDLFATVTELADFSQTLADNDAIVRAFLKDLAGVSATLAGEGDELKAALRELASAVGVVRSFVKDNRALLVEDVARLTKTVKGLNAEKESVDTVLQSAATSLHNLYLAYNKETDSVGSRFGFAQNVWQADQFLCALIRQTNLPQAAAQLACTLISTALGPLLDQVPAIPPTPSARGARAPETPSDDLAGMLGGGR